MEVRIKRVYEKPGEEDGMRVLVDRIWPRGLTKQKAKIDLWMKEIAPSTELRKWFHHDAEKWKEFKKRYRQELKSKKEELEALKKQVKNGIVTLVYSAKDEAHNQALVVKEVLQPK
jgi:uncharacterized protein YeaO (DUF488 family)